jgi:hypothetical protein
MGNPREKRQKTCRGLAVLGWLFFLRARHLSGSEPGDMLALLTLADG